MCPISDTVKRNGTRHNVRLIPQQLGIPYLPLGHLWVPTAILMHFVWGWEAVNLKWIEHPWYHIMHLSFTHFGRFFLITFGTLLAYFCIKGWPGTALSTVPEARHPAARAQDLQRPTCHAATPVEQTSLFAVLSRLMAVDFCPKPNLQTNLLLHILQSYFTYFKMIWLYLIVLTWTVLYIFWSSATCSHSWSRWCDRIQHSTASWQPLPPCARGSSFWSTQNCGVSLQAEIGKSWKIYEKKTSTDINSC